MASSGSPPDPLAHAEAMLEAARQRTIDPHADQAQAQQSVAYWRERVRALREAQRREQQQEQEGKA
jgi:hypothetical protein